MTLLGSNLSRMTLTTAAATSVFSQDQGMCQARQRSRVTETAPGQTPYLVPMPATPSEKYHPFAQLIRDGRTSLGWTQEDLIEESGVSRSTVSRYEAFSPRDQPRPEPENVRKIFNALGLSFIEAVVALGYLTREEAGLPPEPPRVFDASVEEVIEILQDPEVPDSQKTEWVHYLRFRTGRSGERRRRRSG